MDPLQLQKEKKMADKVKETRVRPERTRPGLTGPCWGLLGRRCLFNGALQSALVEPPQDLLRTGVEAPPLRQDRSIQAH